MFLQLAHTKLNVFQVPQDLAIECYKMSKLLPESEKFAMVQQLRRAALSVHLNITEGCSRKSRADRRRFFEISRGSVVEIDIAIGIAFKLAYLTSEELQILGNNIVKTFKLLSGMIEK